MSLADGLWREQEGVVVGVLEDAITAGLVDSVLVLGRHAEKKIILCKNTSDSELLHFRTTVSKKTQHGNIVLCPVAEATK